MCREIDFRWAARLNLSVRVSSRSARHLDWEVWAVAHLSSQHTTRGCCWTHSCSSFPSSVELMAIRCLIPILSDKSTGVHVAYHRGCYRLKTAFAFFDVDLVLGGAALADRVLCCSYQRVVCWRVCRASLDCLIPPIIAALILLPSIWWQFVC